MEGVRDIAQRVHGPQNTEYLIWRSSLGYLVLQIYSMSQGMVKIQVYEADELLQDYVRRYGVLNWIPQENLYVEEDADIMKLLDYTKGHDNAVIISEWTLPSVPAGERAYLEKWMGSA